MKAKLLKKLRKEIFNNSYIFHISSWSGYLCTFLDGVKYSGKRHSILSFSINAEKIGKELEHKALAGYINTKRK